MGGNLEDLVELWETCKKYEKTDFSRALLAQKVKKLSVDLAKGGGSPFLIVVRSIVVGAYWKNSQLYFRIVVPFIHIAGGCL